MSSNIAEQDSLKPQLASILECSLCMSLICDPITISCGHTFCRVCLVMSLRRHKKKCPTCRAVCHVAAETAEENTVLKKICTSIFPDEYALRVQECNAEKATWSELLPIFYYNDIQFPGYILSLHLFEPRYKLMMQRVVNSNRKFAYVPNYTNYRATVGDVALIATLTDCEFMSDGRCLLDSKLTERCIIVDHFVEEGTQGLHFCRVKVIKDDLIDTTTDAERYTRLQHLYGVSKGLADMILSKHRRSIEAAFGPSPGPNDYEGFSLWLCNLVPLTKQVKFDVMKSTNTIARYEACISHLLEFLSTQPQMRERLDALGYNAESQVDGTGNDNINSNTDIIDENNNTQTGNIDNDNNNNNDSVEEGEWEDMDDDDEEEDDNDNDDDSYDEEVGHTDDNSNNNNHDTTTTNDNNNNNNNEDDNDDDNVVMRNRENENEDENNTSSVRVFHVTEEEDNSRAG